MSGVMSLLVIGGGPAGLSAARSYRDAGGQGAVGIVTDAARNVGAALPVGAVVAQLVASLRAQGDGGLDHSALLRAVERLSGAQL